MPFEGVLLSFNGPANAAACQAAARYCRQHGLFLKKFSIQLEPVNLIEKITGARAVYFNFN
jgi:hypothetical protein